jgi:hypothetical protein
MYVILPVIFSWLSSAGKQFTCLKKNQLQKTIYSLHSVLLHKDYGEVVTASREPLANA